MVVPTNEPTSAERWLARASLALFALTAVLLVGFAAAREGWLLLVVAGALVVVVAASFWFLAYRGGVRWLAAALLIATPLTVAILFVTQGALLELTVTVAVLVLAVAAGRAGLDRQSRQPRMPEYAAPAPTHPFLVMNPRSGGGKVARFGLVEKARALGAEVALLEGPQTVDVVALATDAVTRGADLLGVAGGDGTQALVAGVAAEHDVPFVVISAGTRNHFALDLGLDRDDPSTCLEALTDRAVELHVDLGLVGGRTFVNNASFGAYAAVVQTPEYRDDKTHTTLEVLPELLTGHRGARLTAQADGLVVEHPQAVLVSVDPYGTGDVAGLGRRARLDSGTLGVVAVMVSSARQALGLLRRTSDRGITATEVPEVSICADSPEIPVGVDGEALVLPTPVRCTVRPRALRVRVPVHRPGMRRRRAPWSWVQLRNLAFSRAGRGQ